MRCLEYGKYKLPLTDDVLKIYVLLNFFNRDKLWEDTDVKDGDDLKCYHMDVIWGHLVKQNTIFGKLEFDLPSKVAKLVLVLPHSSAGEERVFSMVQKTRQRLVRICFSTPLVPY